MTDPYTNSVTNVQNKYVNAWYPPEKLLKKIKTIRKHIVSIIRLKRIPVSRSIVVLKTKESSNSKPYTYKSNISLDII